MEVLNAEKLVEKHFGEFEKFYNLLNERGKQFNLTSIFERDEVYAKHFYDSVFPSFLFEENAKIIEVGSGGGFPSVPLKIVRRDLDFTLLEATGKKCTFLNEVKDLLAFENFTVINGRAEEEGKGKLRETFDYAVARAVAPLRSLLEYLMPLIKVGGRAVAYKGGSYAEEVKEAENAIKILGGKIEKTIEYSLPNSYGERCVIVIKKEKNTPAKYPRGQGKEKKCPL